MTPAVLRYLVIPLRTAPLLLIVLFSVLLALASGAGLLGLPLALILLSAFFKYAFVLLDCAADGVVEPPVLSVEMINPVDDQRSLVLLIVPVAMYYLFGTVSSWIGPQLAAAIAIAVAAVVPAMIAVQGATGSIVQSFDPRTCFALMLRLRGDYLLILTCMASFGLLGYAIAATPLADALPFVVRIALLMYAWLAIFALIGGVLFERRLDIGLEAAHAPERIESSVDAEVERTRDRQIDRIYAEWRGGAHANAWQSISTHLAQSADPLVELRWLHERTAAWPDKRLADRLAQELLPRLLVQRDTAGALAIVRARLKANPRFRPIGSADLLALVRLARDAGERPTARLLLEDFAHFYPDDPAQPVVDGLVDQLAR